MPIMRTCKGCKHAIPDVDMIAWLLDRGEEGLLGIPEPCDPCCHWANRVDPRRNYENDSVKRMRLRRSCKGCKHALPGVDMNSILSNKARGLYDKLTPLLCSSCYTWLSPSSERLNFDKKSTSKVVCNMACMICGDCRHAKPHKMDEEECIGAECVKVNRNVQCFEVQRKKKRVT